MREKWNSLVENPQNWKTYEKIIEDFDKSIKNAYKVSLLMELLRIERPGISVASAGIISEYLNENM